MTDAGAARLEDGLVLALDTSSHAARVAVVGAGGAPLAAAERQAARHSSNLLRLVDEVLRSAGTRVDGLAAIACGAGPGSFTGLRVGLAVAKGLALPFETPLVLVPSLDALALDLARAAEAPLVVACIDAGKEQVHARLYRRAGADLAPDAAAATFDPGALAEAVRIAAAGGGVIVGGNGADRYAEILRTTLGADAVRTAVPGPSAASIAALARGRLARGERDDLDTAVPQYGRPPDITKPRRAP